VSPTSIPLLRHESPDAIVAFREGRPIAAGAFLAAAADLGRSLPAARHVLNVCRDRYQFTVGLAACLMTGRISLLPSTHTPEVIRRLVDFAPDVLCLTDEPDCNLSLPRHLFRRAPQAVSRSWDVPHIPADQIAAIVFTSGSTGLPLPYAKTWGKLARCIRDGAPRLGVFGGEPLTLVGTVPAQHMYGFESTVLLALQSGGAFAAERPFYPVDITAAIAGLPRPRALVSTPLHLRALLAAGLTIPALDLIVSATAPLTAELATEIERESGAPVLEIYGSTETGQIATRRTAGSRAWQLWPDVRLTARDGQVFAHGGHVEQSTPLCDLIEILDDRSFHLLGRTADLVNVAGKRSSLAYLTAQLIAIPGVVDGAFFVPVSDPAAAADVIRVAAAVVAPELGAAQLMAQLRQRIDPAFLPRPLLLVDALPRNATGKLPQLALQTLAARRAANSGAP